MKLPKRILPIVERLRAEVPKPSGDLYTLFAGERARLAGTSIEDPCPRWDIPIGEDGDTRPTCPMGLHKDALNASPNSGEEFRARGPEDTQHLALVRKRDWGGIPDAEIKAFADWWDSLTLDKACKAVEEIWK